jgi:hypothetical protein
MMIFRNRLNAFTFSRFDETARKDSIIVATDCLLNNIHIRLISCLPLTRSHHKFSHTSHLASYVLALPGLFPQLVPEVRVGDFN